MTRHSAPSRLTAIGVLAVGSSPHGWRFRIRVKRATDDTWRNAVEFGELSEAQTCDSLVQLGIEPERARRLVASAQEMGTTATLDAP